MFVFFYRLIYAFATQFSFKLALAMVAGLFGAILGSTHPIASVLVCAFAGAITSGSIITFCIATLPNHVFGVSICYNGADSIEIGQFAHNLFIHFIC